ncbi:hypothetical protein L228DRAFT_104472 [Xylona heveae TC161]|uniref:Amino acid permease/ SLC12A domain-containing protein n=1 Tax=Xylona heveae (strain CBS 132557 / TC161) TaxID=1328760 RepID=A0A161TQY4_XYLHT|nr:hypothetical protein L228DRAFT_104472 [Xylona heveae TC161]KZF24806.1 hypothetical protein L228DRAFT_104472 [Xylona heveae TC161]
MVSSVNNPAIAMAEKPPSLEKEPMADVEVGIAVTDEKDDRPGEGFGEVSDLKRGLKQRHIQMIALAGTIGTGLFLSSGKAIARGGPVGTVIAYTVVGLLVSTIVFAIAELSALVPLSGGIIRPAEYFFDPALGFAQGWNTTYATAMLLPSEMVACAVIIRYWTEQVNNAVWITILGFLLLVSNMFFVGVYGELEFICAILKILLVVGSVIMGIVVDLGGGPKGHRLGFQYWKNPGPFVQYLGISGSWGQFLGFWRVMGSAVYSFSNVENISVAAAETENPRRNIPKAAKRVFVRVLLFYITSMFVVSLVVASNDPGLSKSAGDASASPFVLAASSSGIHVVPSIINAVVLTSAWSAGNSAMLGGSRVLYGLAREGHAPKIFTRTSRFGIPYVAVLSIGLFMVLGYMTLEDSASTVFDWFQDLVSAATYVHWIIIAIVYLRFYYGCKKQNISRDELPWKSPFQPYATWVALVSFTILLLTGGYTVFLHGEWDAETFVSNYFNIPLIFALYFGYKVFRKTKMVSLEEMPIRRFIEIYQDNPEPPEEPKKGWRKLNILW